MEVTVTGLNANQVGVFSFRVPTHLSAPQAQSYNTEDNLFPKNEYILLTLTHVTIRYRAKQLKEDALGRVSYMCVIE